jgi:3-methyladenine DNA glycosylase AlkC
VKALLGIETIFGKELPQEAVFVDAVMKAYQTLLQKGAKATVAQYARHSGNTTAASCTRWDAASIILR